MQFALPPKKNPFVGPTAMLFSVATLPSNRPANPVQKGSCLLKFLMLRWWENPRHPKSSNYLVRRCERILRKFSLWRCFGGVQTRILKRCDWMSRGKHESSGNGKLVDIGGLGWYCQTPKPPHPNHHFFCHLLKSEDNEVAIHQGFGMSRYLDFTHLPVPWGRFVAAGW